MSKLKLLSQTMMIPMLVVSLLFSPLAVAQSKITVKGTVIDGESQPVIGATVMVDGTQTGVTTDINGAYTLTNVPSNGTLKFSCLGYQEQLKPVKGATTINAIMLEDSEALEEAVAVAFGTQKKESVIASVATINPQELKVPSSNLTTAFAGRIAGLISYQRSGEPGEDNAQFFIRGVTTFGTGKSDPLILIDGVEMTSEDLSRLTTDDIASFSIMKDANATALYGARGANGVILVTTKEGREGAAKVQLRVEGSFSSPTENVETADNVTFMKMYNEAVRTRDDQARVPYTDKKIDYTARGLDPLRYPSLDWQDIIMKDNSFNQRYNLNISGGGTVAKYYIAASYTTDSGLMKASDLQNFSSNINIRKYSLRSNVNVKLTKTTEAIVRLSGMFDDYTGPLQGGTALYKQAMLANPVAFQPYYEPDEANIYTKHILFGNTEGGTYLNPYAELMKGYKNSDRSTMYVQFEMKQDLKFITDGLSARAMLNVNRYAELESYRSYNPFYYSLASLTPGVNDEYKLEALNADLGTDYLSYSQGSKSMQNSMYFEGALQYNNKFKDRHNLSGLLVFTLRESKDNTYDDVLLALPHRNAGLAGRFTYSYNDRYFAEANFGYNGSERFAAKHRWGFFPSAGLGWIVSNEPFMESSKNVISKLKLKATYGLVGNDEIGSSSDRFFYLSNISMNNSGRGMAFGDEYSYIRNGVSISRYADEDVTWEISRKLNLGLELNLWNSLEIQADYFRENRSNILMSRQDIPSTMGLQAIPKANIGKANGSGFEVSLDYNKSFSKDFWTVIRGNFTYATSVFDVYEEPDYSATPWRSHVGQAISQQWGYIAERLFIDEEEVENSPVQTFGPYQAGDIKYKDINEDGIIDENDLVPIGYPTTPEIIYGFGVSLGYKNLDFSMFFQGSGRSSFFISPSAIAPFRSDSSVSSLVGNRSVLKSIADSYWSEDNRDIYAFWPRLSDSSIANNEVTSTWWMRDGSFLRLKTVELGYRIPSRWAKAIRVNSARLYLSGSNIFQIRTFKMWDPEQAGNAFNYPLQRVINIGANIEF